LVGEQIGGIVAEVVLFHHAQGLTTGVTAFADRLRERDHLVHTPDLLDGRTFATLDDGMSYVQELGFGEILERGAESVVDLPDRLVYIGFSLGVLPAQMLAQTRPGVLGAVLCYSCVPVGDFGSAWPGDVPVQVHGMDADPIFVGEGDLDAARELVASSERAELFLYPGAEHYFADDSLPSYDPAAAALLLERVSALLDSVGR
jgi:dienelactone hydrolase